MTHDAQALLVLPDRPDLATMTFDSLEGRDQNDALVDANAPGSQPVAVIKIENGIGRLHTDMYVLFDLTKSVFLVTNIESYCGFSMYRLKEVMPKDSLGVPLSDKIVQELKRKSIVCVERALGNG